jgi:WD40 repeat protein
VQENALSQADAALVACPPELRGWEWRRLRYVVNQGRGLDFDVGARIECLAASGDGRLVVTGSRDGVVRAWDVRQEQVVHDWRLPGSQGFISAVALAPDGTQVAIGSNLPERYLQLWDLATGQVRGVQPPDGHAGAVLHAVFNRDGSELLTTSRDGTAKRWDVSSGQLLTTYLGHSRMVWSAAFSPDETHLATASEDGTVRLWHTETGQEWTAAAGGQRLPFTGHRGPVYAVAFLPAGAGEAAASLPGVSYVASAGYDKRILLWKPADLVPFDYRKLLAEEDVASTPAIELVGHTAAVRDLALSPDGQRLLSASTDHTLRTWYAREEDLGYAIIKRGTLDKELRGHDGPVQAARFWQTSNDQLVSAGYDGKVRFWSVGAYHEERPIPGLVLRGHLDAVMAARFSHDGQSIVTASPDRTAKKWNVADGAERITFREGHAYLTSKAIFFADRSRLLTAAVDGSVRIWNVETGAELLKITGTGYRSAAALSADDRWILTGSDRAVPVARDMGPPIVGQAAMLWDAETGKPLQVLAGHKTPVTAVAFSADGELAFSGDDHGVDNLWEPATGKHLARLDYHLGSISAALFTPDGKTLLTASADKTVCPWDLRDLSQVAPRTDSALRHPAAVTSMALAADGERLLTGCEDGELRLWDRASGELAWLGQPLTLLAGDQSERSPQRGDVNAVAISPDGRVALSVDSIQHIVRLFDMQTGREVLGTSLEGEVDHFLRLRRRDAIAWSAAFSPDGQHVVTVGGDEARVWDLQGAEVASLGPHRPVIFAAFSPDDAQVVSSGWDRTARIWNADDGRAVMTLSAQTAGELGGHAAAINSAVYAPAGQQVLTAGEDGTVRLWDLATRKVLRVYRGHQGGVTRALFLADGQRFLTASRDGTALLWDIARPESPLQRYLGHRGAVLDVAPADDGGYLLTGGADNTARVWDTASGELLLTLEGHTGEVTAVAFYSGDKLRALTGSADQTAKLWDIETPLATPGNAPRSAKELLTLKGHTRGLTSVAFAPDGSAALTASRDGVAILWPVVPASLLPAGEKSSAAR